tara:strand:- start:224 stop:334 length:111 start_codon:yes stop_codon:yes gene_type:complete
MPKFKESKNFKMESPLKKKKDKKSPKKDYKKGYYKK